MSQDYYDYEGAESGGAFDPRRLLAALRRRRKLIAIIALVGLPPALMFAFLQRPLFQARATVAIQTAPEVMDFGADFMPGAPVASLRFNALARAEGVILSDRVLGRVVDRLPPAVSPSPPGLLSRVTSEVGDQLDRLGLSVSGDADIPAEARRHALIEVLRNAVEIGSSGGGTILEITAYSEQPAWAAGLANAIAEAFVAYEEEERHAASDAALTWLGDKTLDLRSSVRAKEEGVARLIKRLGGPQRPAGAANEVRDGMAGDLQQARVDLLATEQRLAQIGALLGDPAKGEPSTETVEQYGEAKSALEAARLRYTEGHPEVQRLRSVVAELGSELGTRADHDPLRESRRSERQELDAERGRLRARVRVLESELEALAAQDERNTELSSEYERLQRELEIESDMLRVLLQRRNETLVSSQGEAPLARVLDYAVAPMSPARMNRPKWLVLGVGFVLALAFGAAGAREVLDRTVYDAEAVGDALGAPVLATIPVVSDGSEPERQSVLEEPTLVAECYRNLRTSILFAAGRSGLRSLLVTSAVASEGKTTTAVNLAQSFAQTGRKVLLIDADLRRPRLHAIVGVPRSPGLTEVLKEQVKVGDVIQRPEDFDFEILTCGEPSASPVDVLGSAALDVTLARLTAQYDLVLIDAPIALSIADALLLSSRVDALVFVAKQGSVDRDAFGRIKRDLERAGANLLGVAFTHVDSRDPYLYPPYLRSPYHEPTRKRRGRGSHRTRTRRQSQGGAA